MKHLAQIILGIMFLNSVAFAQFSQDQDKLVKFLIRKNYISEIESLKLCPDSFISCLHQVYQIRYQISLFGSMSYRNISRNSFRKTEKLLNKLYEFNQMDQETFDSAKQKLFGENEGEKLIYSSYQLISFLYQKEQFDQTAELAKAYLSKLKKLGVINPEIDLESESFQNREQILELFNQRISIDSSFLTGSIDQQYKALHKHVAHELGFNINDYEFRPVEKEYDKYKFQRAQCRFKCNGSLYESVNSYKMASDGNVYANSSFYMVFNKMLADIGSEKRLFAIGNREKQEITLILLDSNQYNFLKGSTYKPNGYFDLDWYKVFIPKYTSAFDYLSREEIRTAFQLFDSLGLNHKGIELEDELQLQFLKSNEDVLEQMADVMLGFDWEMHEYEVPYTYAIKEFASKTNEEFSPKNIKEVFSFDSELGWVSFEFNGKTYKTEFAIIGDWYDGAFLKLIEKAMQENNLNGKFYYLPDGGQASAHIYLSPSQYDYIFKTKMIRFGKN